MERSIEIYGGCCTPEPTAVDRDLPEQASDHHHHLSAPRTETTAAQHEIQQIPIPAGAFLMGDSHDDGRVDDGEGPVHPVTDSAFTIDTTSVTNRAF